ncbi:response regulator [Spirosoma sp. KNUC1025]|uniref:response regulator n=1 Tax=Spirosoma sp. KNUC1025 TaxID=2894082 RepID=UPI0038698974|nr:response regulator [Spirosoma sp. KNUC1025]
MTNYNHSNQRPFARLLADYRARVYETCFSPRNPTEALVKKPASEPKTTLVVIEDNADQWLLTKWALHQRFPQADLIWLSDAEKVLPYLDAFQRNRKDLPLLILVDLYLPTAQQGLQVITLLKSHPLYKPIPTITLSWSSYREDIDQAFAHSADGYLVKPSSYSDWQGALSILDTYWNRQALI